MSSTLEFDGDASLDLDLKQTAVTATIGYVRASQLSLRGSLGVVLDGSLEANGRVHDIGPGAVAAFGAARQWVLGSRGFVSGSLTLGVSRVTTSEAGMARTPLWAVDGRLGGTIGWTSGPVSPYALARVFGGPVFWTLDAKDVVGTDTHHYQLGVGVSVAAGKSLSILVDASLLGERAASLGLAVQR